MWWIVGLVAGYLPVFAAGLWIGRGRGGHGRHSAQGRHTAAPDREPWFPSYDGPDSDSPTEPIRRYR